MDILLKNVPEDVRKIIIKSQSNEKENKGVNQYSMALTIFKIIKEWNNKCKPVE